MTALVSAMSVQICTAMVASQLVSDTPASAAVVSLSGGLVKVVL